MLAFNRFSTWSMIVVVLWLIGLLTVLGGIPSGAEPAGKASNDDVPTQAARQQAGANTNAHEDTCRASGSKEVAGAKESQAVEHFTLSNFYFSHWHLALAEVELEEAIAHWPDFKLAHRNLCLVALFRGDLARAMAEFMMAVSLGDPIPLSEQEKADLNGQALRLHYKRGIEQARCGRWQDACAEFQWAITYDAKDPDVRRSLAFAYASLNDFDQAEREYESTFALDPANAFAHADFAFLLSSNGQNERATRQMSEAVKLAPSAAALHVDLGWMAEARGDLPTAANEFRKAINLSPRHAGLWAHLGRIMERLGRSNEAMDAYVKAVKLDPQYSDVKERMTQLEDQVSS